MPENLPTPPYTKTIMIDGKPYTVKVLPPAPHQTDERCWPVLKRNQRGNVSYVYEGPGAFVDYINTSADQNN